MKKIFILMLPLALVACSTGKNEKIIHVKAVHDGDTFTDDHNIRYRILGADTPEISSGQDFHSTKGLEHMYALMATNFTKNLLLDKNVKIKTIKKGKYGRTVAQIFIDGSTLSEQLIERGLARVAYISNHHTNSKYNPIDYFYDDEEYIKRLYDKQLIAAKEKRGIWNDYQSINIIFPKRL